MTLEEILNSIENKEDLIVKVNEFIESNYVPKNEYDQMVSKLDYLEKNISLNTNPLDNSMKNLVNGITKDSKSNVYLDNILKKI